MAKREACSLRLLSVCHDLPSVASVCQSDGDGDGKSDEGNGDGTGTSKTVASPAVASLSSNSITNTEPRGSAPNPATGASRPPVPLGGLDSPAAKGKSAFPMPAIPYDEDDLPPVSLLPGKLEPSPANQPQLVARVELAPGARQKNELYDVIPLRHTNRNPYDPKRAIPPAVAGALPGLVIYEPNVNRFLFEPVSDKKRIAGI